MRKEIMTPKERWLTVLNRGKPDRIPMDFWATPEAVAKLKKYLECETDSELHRRLHVDKPVTVSPAYCGPEKPANTDVYGCRHRNVDYGTGVYSECIENPLAKYSGVEEIEANYTWPSPDWYDYTVISEQIMGME